MVAIRVVQTRENNEYWADANASPDHNYASDEDSGNEHGEGGSDEEHGGGGGGDELTPPTNVDVVQDQDEHPTEAPAEADHSTTAASLCQFNDLVKCLTEPLDEWAITLYNLKENIIAISGEECLSSRDHIRNCIEEKAPSYNCDHANILAVAERVTDLLVHKRKSGNLLRSYYITAYVCTDEGRGARDEIGEHCMKDEHLGEIVFDAFKYMDEKLSNNHTANGQELCTFLSQRAQLMRDVGELKCTEHAEKAGRLMCESIKMSFLKMYPEKFATCNIECQKASPTSANGEGGGGGGGGGEQPTDGTNGNGQTGANHGRPPTADGTDASAGSARRLLSSVSIALMVLTTSLVRCHLQRTFAFL